MTGRIPGGALAALSGLLMLAAFPPIDAGPIALVAPVPLLLACARAGARRGAAYGFVAGVVFFAGLCAWAINVGYVAYVPLVVTMSLWWAGMGAGLAWATRTSPWACAAVWTAVEMARGAVPFGGFTWGGIGYAAHDMAAARALAPWGGVELITFAFVVTAAALVDLRSAGVRGGITRWIPIAAALIAVVAANTVEPDLHPTGRFRVAVLQGNDKNRRLTDDEVADRLLVSSHLELAATVKRPVDLIVFPESSFDADPRDDRSLADAVRGVAQEHDAAVVANANADAGDGRSFNTNFVFDRTGELIGTYAKRHLVPFGEYVPFRRHLRFIKELEQIPTDFAAGRGARIFAVGGHRVATMICFESAFAPPARGYARRGADVLVVSTNNRSFRRSANAAQHVAMSQLRAAETGRPVVHAAISGVSAFIDARGHARARTALFEREAFVGSVQAVRGRTLYDRTGPVLMGGVVAGALAFGVARGRRRRVARPDDAGVPHPGGRRD